MEFPSSLWGWYWVWVSKSRISHRVGREWSLWSHGGWKGMIIENDYDWMARWLGLLKQFISILFAREFVDFSVGVDKFRWIFLFFCVCPDGCSTLFLTLNKMEMNNQTSWVVKSFLVDLDEGCRVCIRVFQQQLCCWSLILQFFLPQQRKPPTNHTIFREENRWKGCNIHPLHLWGLGKIGPHLGEPLAKAYRSLLKLSRNVVQQNPRLNSVDTGTKKDETCWCEGTSFGKLVLCNKYIIWPYLFCFSVVSGNVFCSMRWALFWSGLWSTRHVYVFVLRCLC